MPVDDSSRIVGKQYFVEQITFAKAPAVPAASFGDREAKETDPLGGTKTQMRVPYSYSQPNTAATTETRALGIVHGAGNIIAFYVGNSARATGAATVVVTLRKNGVSVLTANVTLNNATPTSGAGYASVLATLDPAQVAVVKGDILDVVITATAGGGVLPTEVSVTAIVDQHPTT